MTCLQTLKLCETVRILKVITEKEKNKIGSMQLPDRLKEPNKLNTRVTDKNHLAWCQSWHCPHKTWPRQNSNKEFGRRNVPWLRQLPTVPKELLSNDTKTYLKRCLADRSDVSNQQRPEYDTVNIRS